jgi:hypothetical protein
MTAIAPKWFHRRGGRASLRTVRQYFPDLTDDEVRAALR